MHHAMKITVPLAAALLLAGSVAPAFAQIDGSIEIQATTRAGTSTPRPRPLQLLYDKRMELQRDAKTIRANVRFDIKAATTAAERRDIRTGAQEERKDTRAGVKARVQAVMRANLGAALMRLGAANKSFDALIRRMQSRIGKLNDRGVDTASVEATLSTAISLTAEAKADAEAFFGVIGSVTDTSDVESLKARIRAAIEKATASAKAAHAALLKAAQELAALANAGAGASATTTATVNAN